MHRGDRIAQLVIQRVERARFVRAERLPGSHRGSGGFGSSGGWKADGGVGRRFPGRLLSNVAHQRCTACPTGPAVAEHRRRAPVGLFRRGGNVRDTDDATTGVDDALVGTAADGSDGPTVP